MKGLNKDFTFNAGSLILVCDICFDMLLLPTLYLNILQLVFSIAMNNSYCILSVNVLYSDKRSIFLNLLVEKKSELIPKMFLKDDFDQKNFHDLNSYISFL